ncbi:MAG: hypothetical protein JJT76_10455 [Clostridiaceae bacterium]|nr:hypothetical protein [Clostridiaceae bacterium]
MQNTIIKIRENIFQNNIKTAVKDTLSLVDDINEEVDHNKYDEEQVEILNQIFNAINTSLYNKDYLLLADILEYELKTFINELDLS